MKNIKPAHIIVVVVLIVIAVFALPQLLADQPGARDVDGNIVTETIGTVETNTSAVFQVRLVEGSDPEHESEHMFESLIGMPGVGKASLDTESLAFTVAYDDATIAEADIRAALLEAGYLVPTETDATETEMAEDGSVQTIAIADDGTGFDPFLIRAQAGVPIEMEFAPGTECRTVVKFPEIGVEQNIMQGGTVKLPALEPGQYAMVCSGDGEEGALIVQ